MTAKYACIIEQHPFKLRSRYWNCIFVHIARVNWCSKASNCRGGCLMTLFGQWEWGRCSSKAFCVVLLMLDVSTKSMAHVHEVLNSVSSGWWLSWNSCQSLSTMLRMQMWRLYCLIVSIRRKCLGYNIRLGICCYFIHAWEMSYSKQKIILFCILYTEIITEHLVHFYPDVHWNKQDNEFCD